MSTILNIIKEIYKAFEEDGILFTIAVMCLIFILCIAGTLIGEGVLWLLS